MQVSKDFQRYSEEDIRRSYEKAHNLQMKVAVLRKERQLQAKGPNWKSAMPIC